MSYLEWHSSPNVDDVYGVVYRNVLVYWRSLPCDMKEAGSGEMEASGGRGCSCHVYVCMCVQCIE